MTNVRPYPATALPPHNDNVREQCSAVYYHSPPTGLYSLYTRVHSVGRLSRITAVYCCYVGTIILVCYYCRLPQITDASIPVWKCLSRGCTRNFLPLFTFPTLHKILLNNVNIYYVLKGNLNLIKFDAKKLDFLSLYLSAITRS